LCSSPEVPEIAARLALLLFGYLHTTKWLPGVAKSLPHSQEVSDILASEFVGLNSLFNHRVQVSAHPTRSTTLGPGAFEFSLPFGGLTWPILAKSEVNLLTSKLLELLKRVRDEEQLQKMVLEFCALDDGYLKRVFRFPRSKILIAISEDVVDIECVFEPTIVTTFRNWKSFYAEVLLEPGHLEREVGKDYGAWKRLSEALELEMASIAGRR
jgi:hypothetical protein